MRENFGALINVRLESKRYPKKAKQKITNIALIEILIKRLLLVENKKNIVICTYKSQQNIYFLYHQLHLYKVLFYLYLVHKP